jgi:hypothetical protein
MNPMKAALLGVIIALVPAQRVLAWGQEGHSIVAELAERRLDPDTLRKVKALLGGEASLASVGSWADDYRALHRETAGWHFVDIPFDKTAYDPTRDCDPDKGDCVIHAIARFRSAIADCSKPLTERSEALKFLVHFVADVHQPLHAETRFGSDGKDDRGGNDVAVTFFDQKTNLHTVWDTSLIMHTVYNWGAYVTRLQTGWLNGRDVSALQGGTPIDWAMEAHQFAQNVAYDFPAGGVLGDEYFAKASPVVDRQLALAGIRLARLLQEALRSADACP